MLTDDEGGTFVVYHYQKEAVLNGETQNGITSTGITSVNIYSFGKRQKNLYFFVIFFYQIY